MIQIGEQLYASFSLGDGAGKDFITSTNIQDFTVYQFAGNILPMIELSFILDSAALVTLITPGNILTVSIGTSPKNLSQPMKFILTEDENSSTKTVGFACTIKGRMHNPIFTAISRSLSYTNQTSVQVLRILADRAKIKLTTNVNKTNDLQTWYQEDLTDWEFSDQVWRHAYRNLETFFVFGIDPYRIYFYDMKEWCKQDKHWTLSQNCGGNDKQIIAIDNYRCVNDYGLYAPYINNQTIIQTYNVDSQEMNFTDYQLNSYSSIGTNQLNITPQNTKSYDYTVRDNTVSPYYDAAFYQNIKNNMLFSTLTVYVSLSNVFKDFHLFDICRMELANNDIRLTGKLYITGVAYQFSDNLFKTNLTLNSEAASFINGDINYRTD